MDKVTLLAHYTSLCKGDERKAIMMRNATINRLVLLVEGDINPEDQKELQGYCNEYSDVQYLIEHELLSKHGTKKSGELNSKLYYAMAIPPEDEPELKLVEPEVVEPVSTISQEDVTLLQELDSNFGKSLDSAHSLIMHHVGNVEAMTQNAMNLNSELTKLYAQINLVREGFSPDMVEVAAAPPSDEVSNVADLALVLVISKLLPNTLIKTIKQQRVQNPHVARRLVKASIEAGGDRKEKVLELFNGEMPNTTNW